MLPFECSISLMPLVTLTKDLMSPFSYFRISLLKLMPCNFMTDKTGTVGDRRIWFKKCIKLTLKVIEDLSLSYPFNVPFH